MNSLTLTLALIVGMIAQPAHSPAAPAAARLSEEPAAHPQAELYDPARNASADVDAALARARGNGHMVLLAMGGNWCHDSRALAGWFETPAFRAMIAARYELVYVDVGQRDRNIDIARRFGLAGIDGTPTLLILNAAGEPLNADSAGRWRNAASRKGPDILRTLAQFGTAP